MVKQVFLIPGLSAPHWVLSPMARRLTQLGYETHVIRYHSRRHSISQSADLIWKKIDSLNPTSAAIIGHSMGGLISQVLIDRYQPSWLRKQILIATPNHGVELVNLLNRSLLTRWVLYVVGALPVHDLSIKKECLAPNVCERYPTYSLTGISNKTISQFFIPGLNDGIVSIKSATIPGLVAKATLPYAHGIMIFRKKTVDEVQQFLTNG